MIEVRIPADIEAEAGVLSCLLANARAIPRVVDTLRPEHFHMDAHSEIYRAIVHLYHQEKGSSVFSVKKELERTGKLRDVEQTLGRDCLDDLPLSIDALKSVEEFAEIVRAKSIQRRLYSAAQSIAAMALHQDENALEQAEQLIADIALEQDSKPVASLSDVMDRYMETINQRRDDFSNNKARGVPTGFRDLDAMLGGLQPSGLYILAARPSDGKTALALNVALNVVQKARHVLFFSLEMDENELAQRLISMETPIDQSFLRDGDLNDVEHQHIKNKAKVLSKCDMKIDDRTYTLSGIRAKARRVHMKKKLDLIVVDYLQMIDLESKNKNQTRPEQVAMLSKGLKRLARELKVPVLALAQLNRESERADVPQLSHLGESSSIEKDSDVVMFLHCEPLEREKREQNSPYHINIIVRKHRNGARGTATLQFKPRLTKFQDVEVSFDAV